jgi:predicted Zn-ribbon and HTH transcriptional regulator
MTRKSDPIQPTLVFKEMSIVCPHCQTPATVAVGKSACGKCGLRFSIEVLEPHCEKCGYVLLMNASSRCPECGTAIAG